MPERAISEFWRDLKPSAKVFQPDANPEVYIAGAPTEDERCYYVPFTETVSSRPLWISPSQNKWCDILLAKSAGLVNRHYHPHEVFAYTISGKWGTSSTTGRRRRGTSSTRRRARGIRWSPTRATSRCACSSR